LKPPVTASNLCSFNKPDRNSEHEQAKGLQHDGQYKVSRANAARASAVMDTQKAAIERAREIDPNAAIHVERVRDIGPGRDKWRKIK
jgi:uncharacterized protein YdaT